jgi:hypothetical protein
MVFKYHTYGNGIRIPYERVWIWSLNTIPMEMVSGYHMRGLGYGIEIPYL